MGKSGRWKRLWGCNKTESPCWSQDSKVLCMRSHLFYFTIQETEILSTDAQASFSPVVLLQQQSSSSALRCTSLASPMSVRLGSAALSFERLQAELTAHQFRIPWDWVGPTHRPSRLVHSRPVGLWNFRMLRTLPFVLSVPSCWFSSVPALDSSTLYSGFYPIGIFLLFHFSQNKLVSFSPLIFNTSVIDFCGID